MLSLRRALAKFPGNGQDRVRESDTVNCILSDWPDGAKIRSLVSALGAALVWSMCNPCSRILFVGMIQTPTAFGKATTLKWTYDGSNSLIEHSRKNPECCDLTFFGYPSVAPASCLDLVVAQVFLSCSPVHQPTPALFFLYLLLTATSWTVLNLVETGLPLRALFFRFLSQFDVPFPAMWSALSASKC